MSSSSYVIAGGQHGRQRLGVLSSVMAASTVTLLARVGVPIGARVLDLGCGGGDVTAVLARLASAGRVIGIDDDPQVIAIADEEAAAHGLVNVDYRVGDASQWLAHHLAARGPAFDVVYCRFLLSHVHQPRDLLSLMRRVCAPGGAVVVEDIDIRGSLCCPEHRSFRRSCALYRDTVRACGGDPDIGPRLPAMLRGVGLQGVEANVVQPGGLHGDCKRIQLLTLSSIAPAAIGLGLTDETEVGQLVTDLTDYVNRSDTFVTTARVVQTWGRA